MTPLRWSQAWAVEPERDGTLVLSAGADRRVAVDGVDATTRAAVAGWAAGTAVDRSRPALVDRLVALGALEPVVGPSVELFGDADALADHVEQAGDGLAVAVRTGTDWPAVPGGRVHLGLDLSLHHTIVLGPLVIPGASACLGCLDTRMARRWGTPVVPSRPAAQRSLAVAAELLRVQVALVAGGSSPLVNATVAWDLERGTTDRQNLYKVAGCPSCDPGAHTGRITLPWEVSP